MSVPIFSELGFDELEIVEKIVFYREFTADKVVFEEGSHGRLMYFIVDGKLEVIKKKVGSEEVAHITTVSHGQSVGEMALIDGFVRSATVKAKTDGAFLVLKREDFDNLQEKHPTIGIKILKSISRLISINLRKTSKELTILMLPIT